MDEGSGNGTMMGISSDGSSVSEGSDSSNGSDNSGINVVVGVSDNGGSLGALDDGLALDGGWDGDVVRSIDVNGGGDLDNVLLVDGDIIWNLNTTFNKDGVLDVVDLNLLLDNGGVVGNGPSEDGGDGDREMGGGWLMDHGVVSRNKVSGSVVDLFGDNGGRLVNGGDTLSLMGGGVRGRSSRGYIVDWVLNNGSSLKGVGGKRSSSNGLCSDGSMGGISTDGSSISDGSQSQMGRSSHGASQNKGKCNEWPHCVTGLFH